VSSARLYVGNLTYETTDSSLETLFASHGSVISANVITDRDSGRSKGFGFVEMATLEEAQSAKSSLDGSDLEGRAIKVDMAKERAPRSGGGGGQRW
jgi:cold-inducible RNA-binding protein